MPHDDDIARARTRAFRRWLLSLDPDPDAALDAAQAITRIALRSLQRMKRGTQPPPTRLLDQLAQHAASKTEVSGFAKSLAREVSGRGVLVNAIAPGPIHTPLLDGETEAWHRATLAELPIGRFGKVSEVTPTALLLASDDGSYPLRHVDVQLRRCPRSRAALLGARAGRRILGAVLGELVADGDLDAREATDIARRILGATAWDLTA